mgnify:CR=1 FL=1
MKLNDTDFEFLEFAATERIDQQVAANRETTQASRELLAKLDRRYWEVLENLSDEDAEAIHECHDHSFWMLAEEEKTLYKCGVLDGLRIAKFILELE